MQLKMILLVEDEPILRHILSEGLEEDGFRVSSASSADAAWDMICGGLAFDVLVTDVVMPGHLNGLDLARKVGEDRPHVRIVVMSGYSALTEVDQTVVAFLKKPFTPSTLAAAIAGG